MDEFGLRVDPAAKIWQLSVGEQQRVEILRVLARGARILILDEPTAVLTAAEAGELFKVIRSLVAAGRTVVFISHKLNEVLEVGDRITVLRNGQRVVTIDAAGATARELARLMTGEERELSVEHRDTSANPAVIELRDVTRPQLARPAGAARRDPRRSRGEILGIAGVSGNGQSELAEVLTGLRRVDAGDVYVGGTAADERGAARRSPPPASATSPRTASAPDSSARRPCATTPSCVTTGRRSCPDRLVLRRSAAGEFARRLVEQGDGSHAVDPVDHEHPVRRQPAAADRPPRGARRRRRRSSPCTRPAGSTCMPPRTCRRRCWQPGSRAARSC